MIIATTNYQPWPFSMVCNQVYLNGGPEKLTFLLMLLVLECVSSAMSFHVMTLMLHHGCAVAFGCVAEQIAQVRRTIKRSIIEMQDVDSNKSVHLLLQTVNVSTAGLLCATCFRMM
jgi:hypothetical protein